MITGERLFQQKDENRLAADILEGHVDWTRLSSLRLPKNLLNILRRALHPEQDQRYQSANQMYLDLAKYLTNSGKHIDLTDELHEFMHHLFLQSEAPVQPEPKAPNLDFKSIETPKTPPDSLSDKVAPPIQKQVEMTKTPSKKTGKATSGPKTASPEKKAKSSQKTGR